MQNLGLSDAGARSESRIKSLFWPSIHTLDHVDYLGTQGLWVCVLVALLSFGLSLYSGHPLIGLLILLSFYLAGVGVREHDRYAAALVFVFYLADLLIAGTSVLRIGIAAVLFSNLRATWIASRWASDALGTPAPPRLMETWSDKFADQIPPWLWPKTRILFYVLATIMLALEALALMVVRRQSI